MKIKDLLNEHFHDKEFYRQIINLESPSYIYNLGIIECIVNYLKSNFYKHNYIKLYYAVKANFNLHIISFLRNLVDGFDVASVYELKLLESLSINNFTMTGPSFTAQDVKGIYSKGKYLDFDSFSQMKYSSDIIYNKTAGIRVNIPYSDNNTTSESRFGIDISDANFLEFVKVNNIAIKTLHFHSGEKDNNFFYAVKEVMSKLDSTLLTKECFINLGGGVYNYMMTDTLGLLLEQIEELYEICTKLGLITTFILEPGNALVNLSGFMLSTVISSDCNYKSKIQKIVLDSSAYNLHLWYKPKIITTTSKSKYKSITDIYGPTCYENDIFFKQINFNNLSIGDKVILNPVGAYSNSNHINLHNIPFPIEYFFYNNRLWK